jgi:riboflavin transporter FmnP
MRTENLENVSHKVHKSSFYSLRELAVSSILGALSIFLVFTPDVRLPWGMAALDFIAVPWIIAFLLLGWKTGLLTSIIGFLGIFFFSEEALPLVGATMKFSATIPLILVPTLVLKLIRSTNISESLAVKKVYVILMAIAIVVRCFVTMFLNYYWAIPLMYNLKPSDVPGAFNFFFWGNPLSSNPLVYYILGITLWNTWQGVVDAVVSWFVVYPTNLYKQLIQH